MTLVQRNGDDFLVDAALLAEAFGLMPAEVQQRMRDGAITARCEAGVDEDQGRWRLTFHHGPRACRFVVDASGNVVTRAAFPARTGNPKPRPPATVFRRVIRLPVHK